MDLELTAGTETASPIPKVTGPLPIPVASESLKFGNIEAWLNIIQSYRERHPGHQVSILYQGQHVRNLIDLFKISGEPDPKGFAIDVATPDRDWKDVPKLRRLLAEGGGPHYEQFIGKALYQVLRLF